jgi:hypothetical protein
MEANENTTENIIMLVLVNCNPYIMYGQHQFSLKPLVSALSEALVDMECSGLRDQGS